MKNNPMIKACTVACAKEHQKGNTWFTGAFILFCAVGGIIVVKLLA